MDTKALVYVAGHRGMVGSAIMRALERAGFKNIITRTHQELDLTDQAAVRSFFQKERPEFVYLVAAKVGGIAFNMAHPAEMLIDNLAIQNNVLQNALDFGTSKLMFLGSSCIYPRLCPQPMKEDYLLTGPLEPTNEAYAIAKIAGLKLCQYLHEQYGANFISVMPSNIYGIGDTYDLEQSHFVPALIRRLSDAKKQGSRAVSIWGTGQARRELLFADDLADACIFLMNTYNEPQFVNIGSGEDHSIAELAKMIAKTIGYQGQLMFDPSRPDGMPQKVLDISKLAALGWSPKIDLAEGLRRTYSDFVFRFAS